MKTNIKLAGYSTEGWIVFVTNENKYFCINSDEIKLYEDFHKVTYSWLVNNLRVFTPVEIYFNEKLIEVDFIFEKGKFSANTINLPEEYMDKEELTQMSQEESR